MFNRLQEIVPYGWKKRLIDTIKPHRQGIAPILRGMNRDFEVVFDIGANTGYVSIEMLYYFPKAIVYSFEPCSETYNNLLKNIGNSGYEKRSKPYRLGFFDIETDKILNITSFHGANSIINISDEYHRMNPQIENVKTEVIPLIKMDDFIMQNKIDHIDLVKIDVEGVEYQILKGGEETFKNKVDTVIMEISFVRHPYPSGEFIKIFQLMHDYGFAPSEIYDIAQSTSKDKWKLSQLDCVFQRYKT